MSNFIYNKSYKGNTINNLFRTISDLYSNQYCKIPKAKEFAVNLSKGHCFYCGERLYDKNKKLLDVAQFDHFYPAANMNLFTLGNIVLSCSSCNIAKSDLDPMKFIKDRFNNSLQTFYKTYNEYELTVDNFRSFYFKDFPLFYELKTTNIIPNELVYSTLKAINLDKSIKWFKTDNKEFFKNVLDYLSRFGSQKMKYYREILNELSQTYQDFDFENEDNLKTLEILKDYLSKDTNIDYNFKRQLVLLLLRYKDEDFAKSIQKDIPYIKERKNE